jgi:hypothetical protein
MDKEEDSLACCEIYWRSAVVNIGDLLEINVNTVAADYSRLLQY